ncbi:YopX family protein [Bacillus toyonensis]|uniref:YopX family protein n=1 Tax=Bacillus toyonensis TaxID=155322 RepID=UPI000BF0C1A2|nr:YopX family protein [Bacillus toyonensis]PEO51245.1 hypothetical protein CN579_28535 [Bacillus toyonensis]PFY36871.1 hypothetical protein COL55_28325 [Bacillus toyonensis]PFY73557.1 hypothetical protein COL62_24250 [Bacillus toyonensis]PHA42879.1 hypothetical protein COE68_17945 [Bacillus toyonensis]
MRTVEIKFRGRPIEDYGDTKWFYGNAVINYEEKLAYIEAVGQGFVPVEWESVGQFTGITNMDEKELYEGHVVKNAFGEEYKIIWDEKRCQFIAVTTIEDGSEWYQKVSRSLEVIGNIYENSTK